jgi:hypothetical protein
MRVRALLGRPSAVVPLLMSGAALLAIAVHIAVAGTAPQPDEGTAAHLWQLLMVAQLPVVGYFAIRWLPRTRSALWVLVLQLAAMAAAAAPVAYFRW